MVRSEDALLYLRMIKLVKNLLSKAEAVKKLSGFARNKSTAVSNNTGPNLFK
jgi:hypothetical protein